MKTLDQKLIDRLSQIQYNGVYIYRYMIDILQLPDSKEDILNNTLFSTVIGEIGISDDDRMTAAIKLNELFDNLSPKNVLFCTKPLRRILNGELYHCTLDPYIDVLKANDYLVLEDAITDNEVPVHTQNLLNYRGHDVISYYGLENIDREEVSQFMDTAFWPLIEEFYGIELAVIHKKSMVSRVCHALCIRQAYICFYTDILQSVCPKVIFYSHGTLSEMCFLYEAASQVSIKCLEIDHGASAYTRNLPFTARHADMHLSYSKLCENTSLKHHATNVFAIGKPGMCAKDVIYQGLPGETIMVCIISSVEEGLLNIAKELSQILPHNKYIVVYKKHSMEKLTFEAEQLIKQECPGLTIMDGSVNITDLYRICQIVIGERSTALVEALPYEQIKIIVRKQVSNKNFDPDGCYGFYNNLEENNELIRAADTQDIIKEICNYKKGYNYRPNGEIFWCPDAEENFYALVEQYIRND